MTEMWHWLNYASQSITAHGHPGFAPGMARAGCSVTTAKSFGKGKAAMP